MKQDKKFEMWIDRSIAQLMKLTGEIDVSNSGESTSDLSEKTLIQILPPHAEASDFLSINEWISMPDPSRNNYNQE